MTNEPQPTTAKKGAGLNETIEAAMNPTHMALYEVCGDCMEAAGIVDGGLVLVDFSRRPAPPRYKGKGGDGSFDVCLCYADKRSPDHSITMVKEYIGVWGPWLMVGTRFSQKKHPERMNYVHRARAILGVVIASFDQDEKLIWERNPASFPEKIDLAQTIHGDNIGPPRSLHTTNVYPTTRDHQGKEGGQP